MNAWVVKADAGTLSLDELRSLYDSLDSLDGGKYRAEASRVYAMIMDLEEPKLTDQEQQELDAQTKLEAMFYGDPSSIIPVATLPEPGQLVAMGLDAVEAKPSRIVLARPGARQGIAVLAGRARDLYEAVPRMVVIGGYSPGYYVNRDNRPVMQFIAARWDEGIILNTWEVEERTQWPTLTEAIASVYASGGTLDIFAQELEEVAALPAEEIKARKRPEGKPPSPQQWRKVKAKLKGMARQADGEDMESLRETAQRIQALRGYYGQVDEASRNKRTRPLTKKTLISWAKAPGRMDLEGIDTPR
jgi:hypothetical protein